MSRLDDAILIRFGSLAFAVLAITLAVIQLDREAAENGMATREVTISPDTDTTNQLEAELARCRALIDPAAVDDACRRAWAERRARFFGAEVRP